MSLRKLKETVLNYLTTLEYRVLDHDTLDAVKAAITVLPNEILVGVEVKGGAVQDLAANIPDIHVIVKDFDGQFVSHWLTGEATDDITLKQIFADGEDETWDVDFDWTEEIN